MAINPLTLTLKSELREKQTDIVYRVVEMFLLNAQTFGTATVRDREGKERTLSEADLKDFEEHNPYLTPAQKK